MNPTWIIRTGRTVMTPVGYGDLRDLQALKADPRVFAIMLGGVRGYDQTARELAEDSSFWAERGYGMWTVRYPLNGTFLGIAGLMDRPDGLGVAMRFAFRPEVRGQGLAREAAAAALRFGHDRAGLDRIIAVAVESNFNSRTLLGAIGMWECGEFMRHGERVLIYESRVTRYIRG